MDSARLAGQAERTAALVIPVKTGIQDAAPKTMLPQRRRMRTIPTCHCVPRGGGAPIQRAGIRDRLSLCARCTLSRTLPPDATGLDSRLRGNDIDGSGVTWVES